MNLFRTACFGLAMSTLGLIVAACAGGTAGTSGGANPSPALPSVAIPSNIPSFAIPSIAIPPGPGSGIIPSFSLPSGDKDLENRLPNQLNGVTMRKLSFTGAEFLAQGGEGTQTTLDFLTSLGKSPNDLSAAFASDPDGNLDVTVGAFRVAGADASRLMTEFVNATKKDRPDDLVQQANLGGRNVMQITDPADATTGSLYIYANGDTLFYAQSPDQSLATTALQALP